MVSRSYCITCTFIGMQKRLLDVNVLKGAAGGMSGHYLVEVRVQNCRGFQKSGNDKVGESKRTLNSLV